MKKRADRCEIEPRAEAGLLGSEPHGGLDVSELRRLGIAPDQVVDFSVCLNPFGPAPGVAPAIARAAIDTYPDRDCRRLRAALAEHLCVVPTQVLVGNGSSELIALAALAYVRPGDRVLVLGPTYGEYARAARLMGGKVIACNASAGDDFKLGEGAVRQGLQETRPGLVFLCNPNNPTGTMLPVERIAGWAKQQPGCLFVVDEAYLSFAADAASACFLGRDNILVLRSLTKDHALAGVRVGYAVGAEAVIDVLARVRTPWSVSTAAEAAGLAAVRDRAHLESCLRQLAQAKNELVDGLVKLGLAVLPSATHYFLVEVGNATEFRARLLPHGMLVRDCTSFGLPGHVRISTRRPEENQRLLDVLAGSKAA
ncbi:MAG: histidinol-phosphate transaminase, partial [Gemmataceae bacterium]